jgi:hypothetical protein
MKSKLLFLVVLCFATSLAGEDRKQLTVEQCRSDLLAWTADDGGKKEIRAWPVMELLHRTDELADCEKLDRDERVKTMYAAMIHMTDLNLLSRHMSFIRRHHLTAQFVAEDKTGAR